MKRLLRRIEHWIRLQIAEYNVGVYKADLEYSVRVAAAALERLENGQRRLNLVRQASVEVDHPAPPGVDRVFYTWGRGGR